jgi:hypothetical protein
VSLAEQYAAAADEAPRVNAPRGWEPGVKYEPTGDMLVTTPPTAELDGGQDEWRAIVENMGLTVPDGYRVRLVEAKHDPAAWTRDTPAQDKAVTRPVWRLRFAVEPDPGLTDDTDLADIAALIRSHKKKPPQPRQGRGGSFVVVPADWQVGKTGSGGGTDDLVKRVLGQFDRMEDRIRDLRKLGYSLNDGYWLDAGDIVEGFNNAVAQHQTNDLAMTRQIRVARRLSLEGLGRLARTHSKVTAAACGSNHCQVRIGKDRAADPGDDWGIEILTQIADAYALNPDVYGHVEFRVPETWRETLAIEVEGRVVGLTHGHQAKPGQIASWWRGQSHGRQPVADADILVSGHYHSLLIQHTGNGRTHIQAPTSDAGSDWFTNNTGEVSQTGLLTFVVTPDGWEQLAVL